MTVFFQFFWASKTATTVQQLSSHSSIIDTIRLPPLLICSWSRYIPISGHLSERFVPSETLWEFDIRTALLDSSETGRNVWLLQCWQVDMKQDIWANKTKLPNLRSSRWASPVAGKKWQRWPTQQWILGVAVKTFVRQLNGLGSRNMTWKWNSSQTTQS